MQKVYEKLLTFVLKTPFLRDRFIRYFVNHSPYSAFCEIEGCRTEVHANTARALDVSMNEHLSRDH